MDGEKQTLEREFLLKEYDNAAQLTFHADDLRDKLSTFFLTFAGAALAAVGLLLQDSFKVEAFGDKRLTAGLFLLGVSVIGVLILSIHARLRRVQLEYFALISRIRVYCLGQNLKLWNTIKLSPSTLPEIRFGRLSGSELWALTILLPTVVLLGTSVDLLLRWRGLVEWWHLAPLLGSTVMSGVLWCLYVALAAPPVHRDITEANVNTWTSSE